MSTDSAVSDAPDETLALAGEATDAGEPEIDIARLRVALARLSRRLRRHELAGLTPTQLAALATVGRSGPMRLGDLAAAEGIAPSTLTRLVTALEEGGYVCRCADPSDARASTLAITPRGNAMLDRIRTETTRRLAASLQMLTPGQRYALAAALPVLERLAEPDPAEPRTADRTVLSEQFGEAARQLVALLGHLGELPLEFDDAADRLQRHALVGHRRHLLDDADLIARVAALPSGRPLRRDHLQRIDPSQERMLDGKQLGDLADRVQRRMLVVKR